MAVLGDTNVYGTITITDGLYLAGEKVATEEDLN